MTCKFRVYMLFRIDKLSLQSGESCQLENVVPEVSRLLGEWGARTSNPTREARESKVSESASWEHRSVSHQACAKEKSSAGRMRRLGSSGPRLRVSSGSHP